MKWWMTGKLRPSRTIHSINRLDACTRLKDGSIAKSAITGEASFSFLSSSSVSFPESVTA
jgi:hypothetical protein